MPTDASAVFEGLQAKPPPVAGDGTPPPVTPKEPGTPASVVFAKHPAPPGALDKLGTSASKVAKKAVPIGHDVAVSALKPYLDDYVQMSNQYAAALKADANVYPEGTLNTLKQMGKDINDQLGYFFAPVTSPLYTGIIKPLQAGIQKMSDYAQAHVEDAAYDAQKQREGVPYPKGKKGFGLNAADVQATADRLKDVVEAFTMAGAGFIGPKEAPAMERPTSNARVALRDLKSAVTPPEPKLTPIAVSIDKSMGFQKVNEAVGKEIQALPVGSRRTAANLIDSMLPHSEGYAKSFLEKLAKNVDPLVPVTFRTQRQLLGNLGWHFPETKQIEVSAGHPQLVQTIIHETVHSTTVNMLDTLIDGDLKSMRAELGRDLTPSEKLAVVNNPRSPVLRELDAIIREAKVRAQKAGRLKERNIGYGLLGNAYVQGAGGKVPNVAGPVGIAFNRMTPRYEFVAEVFSNPVLQEFLANSEKYASAGYKFKNMLNQFTNLIGRHLGMKGYEMRLLGQAMRVGSQLMEMQTKERPPVRGLPEILAQTDTGEVITRGDLWQASKIIKFPKQEPIEVQRLDRAIEKYNEEQSEGRMARITGVPKTEKEWQELFDRIPPAPENAEHEALLKSDPIYKKMQDKLEKIWDMPMGEARNNASHELKIRMNQYALKKKGEWHPSMGPKGGGPRQASIGEGSVRRAKTSLQISVEQILRAVSPESLGRSAKLAASVIASRITERMQHDAVWQTGSSTRLKFWRARPDMTREFIDKFEKGDSFSDPVLSDLAKRYRDWGNQISDHDRGMGFEYEPRENYLAHIFEDQDGVAEYFARKYGSKWGDPSFVKDRTFDLYKEAREAGFTPRFDNPEDIMLARQHASDIAAMHTAILKDLEKFGLATLKVVGKEELKKTFDTEGKARFDIVKTEGTKQPPNTVRWRAPNGDVYWLDARADAVMQNAFKSKSLWEDKGLGGTLFRGMMSLKNALVPIRLALSLFHPLHVVGIDASAGITRAMVGMLSGTTPIHKGLAELLSNGLMYKSIWENPKSGWRVMKAWQGKIPASELTEADARALQTLVEMGISPDMSVQYRTNARKNFLNAVRDTAADFRMRKPLGVAGDVTRAVWHLPWATVSALSKPVFEVWIPALKAASALKDAENLLKRNPGLVEDDAQRMLAMRRLGKSVENRYGEMNYSTLFWKRWVKDLSVLDTLSLGWQLGFIREYGGGMMDLGQWVKNTDKMQQIKKGQLDKAIFVSSYTTLGAAVGGLMTWAMTGSPPTSLLDYISPRTGEKNPDGSDARVSTMFYHREFASLYKHIQNEGVVPGVSDLVLNKGSGLFGLMHEWATGVNGFGQEIRDPEGDAFQKLEQTLAYSLSDIEPISMRAIQQNVSEQPVKSGVLTVLGFTPAPKYLTESVTAAHIKQMFSNYVAPKQTPFEKAEFSKEYSQLRAQYQSGSDQFGESLNSFVEKNELSGQDIRRLMRSLNSTLLPEQRMFMRLPWTEQIKILNKASPEERDLLLPHANREHVRNRYVPPDE